MIHGTPNNIGFFSLPFFIFMYSCSCMELSFEIRDGREEEDDVVIDGEEWDVPGDEPEEDEPEADAADLDEGDEEIPSLCGNGILDEGEECDNGPLNSDTTPNACRTDCRAPWCGDAVIDDRFGDECDDGTLNNDERPNACRTSCLLCFCGDGVVDRGEECDDGNGIDDDGCTNACYQTECGNGIVEPGEECDDGNLNDNDVCPSTCLNAVCGDGYVWDGVEECDDGDFDDTNDCTTSCRNARCGDGIVWADAEECDDGNLSDTDSCLATCEDNVCGDGYVFEGTEECDDGGDNRNEPDACRTDCTLPRCGDAITDTGEMCDDGNTIDNDGCSNHCSRPGCGNGIPEAGEECDDGNDDNTDACLDTCLNASCGDGYVWAGHEDCDTSLSVLCTTTCGSIGAAPCTNCVVGACLPPFEECNGLDDDCDGYPDNGYECVRGSGVSCTTSCGSAGSGVCTDTCQVPAGPSCTPPGEECNGVDDDCDGTCDNGFKCCSGTSGPCITSCGSNGSMTCSSSCLWGSCVPPAETCNGADDDCDGVCDNGYDCCRDAIEACTTTGGHPGTRTCLSSCAWGDCIAGGEVCNGIDDDGDTLIDEYFECVMGETTDCITECGSTGSGACSPECTLPPPSSCTPPSERCNGVDDDCDGHIDEDFDCVRGETVPCTTACGITGEGVCTDTCTIPGPSDCPPLPEQCCETSDCDDGEECTDDSCVSHACRHSPAEDGRACTGGICCGGACRAGWGCCSDADCTDGCKGTALGCNEFSEVRCETQTGCIWSPLEMLCFGTSADPCSNYDGDQGKCEACGCIWNSVLETCTGSPGSCDTFADGGTCGDCGCNWGTASCSGTSPGSCDSHAGQGECEACGCTWLAGPGQCTGDPAACYTFAESAACGNCGCDWEYECSGTHQPCTSYSSQAVCDSQRDCYWSICRGHQCI